MKTPRSAALLLSFILFSDLSAALPEGWTEEAPRLEIRPSFRYDESTGIFSISHDNREGLDGWYQKSFPVAGGSFVQFKARRRSTGVADSRHSGLSRIVWKDANGRAVPSATAGASAEPEHPVDGPSDADGWTTVSGIYQIPPGASQALVELHLQHAPNGTVEWSSVSFEGAPAPAPRKVRLATVQHIPSGRSPRENCEEYAPLVREAALMDANIVVLGETIPYARTKLTPVESAEPVPGPTTQYFGGLAKQHSIHIALSLYERSGHLVFNSAVLLGPDGALIGKYRKVCLPHSEVEKGVAPGGEYPVFDTAFGKVGLMVCYDGFFPEVARALTAKGAEIIAWPVWGCDPLLARARACENRVFVVSSTFTDPKKNWMISAVYDRTGSPIAQAEEKSPVAVAEVDLATPLVGPYNLGDFRSIIQRHRP
jgi:predicted amidohydrolase